MEWGDRMMAPEALARETWCGHADTILYALEWEDHMMTSESLARVMSGKKSFSGPQGM